MLALVANELVIKQRAAVGAIRIISATCSATLGDVIIVVIVTKLYPRVFVTVSVRPMLPERPVVVLFKTVVVFGHDLLLSQRLLFDAK